MTEHSGRPQPFCERSAAESRAFRHGALKRVVHAAAPNETHLATLSIQARGNVEAGSFRQFERLKNIDAGHDVSATYASGASSRQPSTQTSSPAILPFP